MRSLLTGLTVAATLGTAAFADPLPSWNDTPSRDRIVSFVDSVTTPGSDSYVTPADRVAVFDNDGTLWSEQPVYFQLIFAMDRIAELADKDPSILTSDALKAAANGDAKGVLAGGKEALIEVLLTSHSAQTTDEFTDAVSRWLDTAKHPTTGMAYDAMTYQPMVELLRYLRDEGFATYIVSGGGVHFMRAFAQEAYGIPPEQILGTSTETEYTVVDGVPTIMKLPSIAFIDDKEGKPINIDRVIGKRPIFAAGNSDGDFQMLQWSTAGDGPRFGMLVHHTDGDREFAYDRDSHVGKLVNGLDKGPDMGWLIVDMAKDWARVYTGSK